MWVAVGGKSGLPSQEMLEALHGHNLLGTDQNEWMEVRTGGKLMWGEVELRKKYLNNLMPGISRHHHVIYSVS
jgi:hypothetical protein